MTLTKTSIPIEKALLERINILTKHLNITQDQIIELALEQFLSNYPQPIESGDQPDKGTAVIQQGSIYWLDNSVELEPGVAHPHVVIQDNLFNHSRISTVVVCALTSNIKRVNIPGNVLLESGEANLPRQSVVEVSKVSTVEKALLGEYIGSLTEERIHQILDGMRFQQTSFFKR